MSPPRTLGSTTAGDRVGVVDADALTPGLVVAWRGLARRALEPNPFAEPEFVVPALRHLGRPRTGVAFASADGRLVAAMPVRRMRRWRSLPVPSVGVWAHAQNPLGTPLLDAHPRAATLLLRAIAPGVATPLLTFDEITADGPVRRALDDAFTSARLRPVTWESSERAMFDKGCDGDIEQLLAARHRRLPGKRRALQRRLGAELRTVDRCDDPAAVERLLTLEAAGWKGAARTAMACVPGHAAFFRAMCRGFAADGRLQLLSLEAAGVPVAMLCNIVAGDTLFHFKSAYDERYRRHSPGLQLLVDMLGLFAAGDLPRLDSCTDADNAVFNDLLPGRRAITRLAVPARHRAALRPAVQAAADLRRRVRGRATRVA